MYSSNVIIEVLSARFKELVIRIIENETFTLDTIMLINSILPSMAGNQIEGKK